MPRSIAIGLVGNFPITRSHSGTHCLAPVDCDRISWKHLESRIIFRQITLAPVDCDRISWKRKQAVIHEVKGQGGLAPVDCDRISWKHLENAVSCRYILNLPRSIAIGLVGNPSNITMSAARSRLAPVDCDRISWKLPSQPVNVGEYETLAPVDCDRISWKPPTIWTCGTPDGSCPGRLRSD